MLYESIPAVNESWSFANCSLAHTSFGIAAKLHCPKGDQINESLHYAVFIFLLIEIRVIHKDACMIVHVHAYLIEFYFRLKLKFLTTM